MSRKKKLLFCVIMLIAIIVVGFRESLTVLRDGNIIEIFNNTNTDSDADVNPVTDENSVLNESTESSLDDGESISQEKIENEIDNILEGMTIEEKVGQLFFIKNDGRFDESILDKYPVGGIILFAGDFRYKSAEEVRENILAFQNKSKYPLLIGTDEEGGSVIRVSKYVALAEYAFLSPRDLYAMGGYDAIKEDTEIKSRLLLSYGINVNFAPVCDVSLNPNDYMYSRSFGESATETSEYVRLVVETMNAEGIGSVLKHFPGYGSNGDTHSNIIRDTRKYQQFETEDFLPFIEGMNAGAECILVSHNIVECMDKDWPASLSSEVHKILRNELGFDGVIITDDLFMDGVSDYVGSKTAAVLALEAGNDMILATDYAIQYEAVLEAVKNGQITEERLDYSIRKILRWKYSLGIME